MLRLPSMAMMRRTPLPPQPPADESAPSPEESQTPETAEVASTADDTPSPSMNRRGSKVQRSRFFLEHEAGQRLDDVYQVDESSPLGQGGFGTVWRARMRGAHKVVRAVKAVKKQSAKTDVMVQEEVAILRSLDHPLICRLFETFDGPKFTYLVMELVDGEELFEYIQKASLGANLLSEDFAANIMRQVFSALQYCHGRSVVHRDLKPENIMVQRITMGSAEEHVEIKLIDFGLAACWTGASRPAAGSLVGTYCYSAPEARHGGKADPASDMWSTGMVLHTLLVGGLPEEAVCEGSEPPALGGEAYSGISRPAKDLLAGLLRIDPSERLTAAEAGACPWLHAEARAQPAPDRIAKTMKAFTCFYRSNLLRRAFLTALAMQLADQHIADLQEQFLSMDSDHNGRISRSELAAAIQNDCPGYHGDVDEWVESIFDSVDTDGSDEIEYTEWLAAAHHEGETRSTEAIHAAFRVFDVDGSGKISVQEIARITNDTPADIAILLPQYDLNGDGELDIEEFKDLVLRAPPLLSPGASGDSLQTGGGRPATAPSLGGMRRGRTVLAGTLDGDRPIAGTSATKGAKGGEGMPARLCRSQTHPAPAQRAMIVSM